LLMQENCYMRMIRRKRRINGCCQHSSPQTTQIVLGVVVLLFVGIQVYYSSRARSRRGAVGNTLRREWISSNAVPFNYDNLASQATELILVAGHSVLVSGHLEDADRDEHDWFLLEYQRNKGLPTAIVKHIQAGLQAAADAPQSLLLFSGGETRAITGPETEGASYYRVVDAMQLWPPMVRARTITEEFATDSFQNLLFSIARFYEVTGRYPNKITVVSFTFKQTRFQTMHAPALQWPADKFVYVGVDPPTSTGFDLEEATKGEVENAAKPFEGDPYGCNSPVLQNKRRERNPFSRTPPYELSCPDMKHILSYCGPELIPADLVPWAVD
jgi:hypothetical protein